jgi:hypothetical protein
MGSVGQAEESLAQMAQERWHAWRTSQAEYPIAAWSYFLRYTGSVAEFQMYKAAGLNMVQVPLDQVANASAAGLQVLLGSWQRLHKDLSTLQVYTRVFTQPGYSVAGYQLFDEPAPSEFADLGKATEIIYRQDERNAIPIITLLPNYAVAYTRFGMSYQQFVRKFIAEVHPAVLLSTHYVTLNNGVDRPEFYANLEMFRTEAANAGIGLMGFVLVTPHLNYRRASEIDLRWQVYSLLAYGAKGLWYYNYRIGDTGYGDGIVTHATGEPSVSYPWVQKINREVQSIGKLLLSLESTVVVHTGNLIPTGTKEYTPDSLAAVDNVQGDDFIIGQFRHLDAPSDAVYMMVVNKRHSPGSQQEAAFSFTITAEYQQVWYYVNGVPELLPRGDDGRYHLTLPGGQGVLLKIE